MGLGRRKAAGALLSLSTGACVALLYMLAFVLPNMCRWSSAVTDSGGGPST